jgi:two-component system, cell cycle response regulator DivK
MNKQLYKILVVDDDERNIFALKAVLASRGFCCVTARGGMQAVHILQQQQDIALALVDMMMPGMDGYELIKRVHDIPALNHVKLVAVTAQAMAGDREKCIAAGADAYIAKPVDTDILFGVVQEQLKNAG